MKKCQTGGWGLRGVWQQTRLFSVFFCAPFPNHFHQIISNIGYRLRALLAAVLPHCRIFCTPGPQLSSIWCFEVGGPPILSDVRPPPTCSPSDHLSSLFFHYLALPAQGVSCDNNSSHCWLVPLCLGVHLDVITTTTTLT